MELTKEIKKLEFKEILQEPCIVQKDGIMGFFNIKDIVFTFKKDWADEVKKIVETLSETWTIKIIGELK